MLIPVTEYHRPNGRSSEEMLLISHEMDDKAKNIMSNGFHFTAELLAIGMIAITISDDLDDYASRMAQNDAQLAKSFELMINSFDIDRALVHRAEMKDRIYDPDA